MCAKLASMLPTGFEIGCCPLANGRKSSGGLVQWASKKSLIAKTESCHFCITKISNRHTKCQLQWNLTCKISTWKKERNSNYENTIGVENVTVFGGGGFSLAETSWLGENQLRTTQRSGLLVANDKSWRNPWPTSQVLQQIFTSTNTNMIQICGPLTKYPPNSPPPQWSQCSFLRTIPGPAQMISLENPQRQFHPRQFPCRQFPPLGNSKFSDEGSCLRHNYHGWELFGVGIVHWELLGRGNCPLRIVQSCPQIILQYFILLD